MTSSLVVRTVVTRASTAGIAFAVIVAGCDVRHVELETGSGTVSTLGAAPGDSSAGYGCADWIDAELNAIHVDICPGTCSSAPDHPYDLIDKPTVMAATSGNWQFCGDHSLFATAPADAVGVELVPGCRIFFLRYDESGKPVRGTEAAYQADFDIFDPRPVGQSARIDLHETPTQTIAVEVEAYRCPEQVHLTQGGRRVVLSRFAGDDSQPIK